MSRSPVSLEDAVKRSIPAGSGIVLGVSGGIDSMVLFEVVRSCAAELRLTLHIAHVDHNLRDSSSGDAEFVRARATAHGVRYHVRVLERPAPGENIEAWGRRHRYAFFEAVRRENDLPLIATAHSADDVAETFLMRLVANKELGTIAPFDEQRKLVRPLLAVPRADIERYAAERGVAWRDDPTNDSLDFLRNRVRHTLVPVLRDFDPHCVETISERARAVAADAALLEGWAARLTAQLPTEWGGRAWLGALQRVVSEAPAEMRWRVVEAAFSPRLSGRLGRRHGTRGVEFILGNGRTLELPGGVVFTRRGGGLVAEKG